MRREVTLAIILLASLTFLFLQILSLKGIDNQIIGSSLGKVIGLRKKTDDLMWRHLKLLSTVATSAELELFVIDPDVLQDLAVEQISNARANNSDFIWNFAPRMFSNCRHICGRKRIVLGAFGKSWKSSKSVFQATMLQQRVQQKCCEKQDPRLLTIDSRQYATIDFHCSYTLGNVVVDIVLFHEWGNFLWHGAVSERGEEIPKSEIEIGKREGAFNRFSLKKETLDGIGVFLPQHPLRFLAETKQSGFVRCDVQRARKFFANHGEGMPKEAAEFTDAARELLKTAVTALDGIGIRFWLSSGTCLETDHMWNGGTRARTGEKYKYIFPKFTLCWTVFLSLRVRVPCETQQYIEANYGFDWDTPVKEWKWNKSPPNVRPNGVWGKTEWPEVIQTFT
ncbi:predicted protein [Nematostella vectensis]|uniref:Ribitol-5-phosphate transferase FKTN N-terminal domain-containing protein n=1 Tax=Nematostella vectensis TaxID=45351 RepID=A7RJX8_NEMVE|nr:predicted protein [Nematostella vectensis]|eukprot:XP_001640226.1 predicted protein [Nematostella vectensis]